MKKYKISIQKGIPDIEKALREAGHEVVYYGDHDMDADVTIICDVDEAYEEIEPVQCHIGKDEEHGMLVIDATNMTPEQVLKHVENNSC